jgi:hypothetical protein
LRIVLNEDELVQITYFGMNSFIKVDRHPLKDQE